MSFWPTTGGKQIPTCTTLYSNALVRFHDCISSVCFLFSIWCEKNICSVLPVYAQLWHEGQKAILWPGTCGYTFCQKYIEHHRRKLFLWYFFLQKAKAVFPSHTFLLNFGSPRLLRNCDYQISSMLHPFFNNCIPLWPWMSYNTLAKAQKRKQMHLQRQTIEHHGPAFIWFGWMNVLIIKST